ncbi:MOG interacting and ectopic P-granules protein 1 isoform X2 [Neocloeon triangulifer]|uniref:MOG interacting and ectopic P-granules protein 1 isoform X2 n=1 Tax=Neocloeon triangulifer TaxID=2078957 RepID=UPI00286F94D3|nr:MOG interacting and ectopic P-granules protein 1 isoform X2 [Neocloeon triangulifer]
MEAVMMPSGETALSKSDNADDASAQVHSNGEANGAGSDGDSPPPAKKSKISASGEVGKKPPILVELGLDPLPVDNGDEEIDSEDGEDENGDEHLNGEDLDNDSVCELEGDHEDDLNGGEEDPEEAEDEEDDDEIQEVDNNEEIQEIDDDEDGDVQEVNEDGDPIDSNDDHPQAGDESNEASNDTTPTKADTKNDHSDASNQEALNLTPRRSNRNVHRSKRYTDGAEANSGESDIEEIEPQDPLAVNTPGKKVAAGGDPLSSNLADKIPKKNTIIVSDTKALAKIAASSREGKKEPTLVIIDTNSILSGRGPVPLTSNQSNSNSATHTAQGYPLVTSKSKPGTPPPVAAGKQQKAPAGLTDDMYVVEAPSFIVPYVYEKPAKEPLKETVEKLSEAVKEKERKEREEARKKRHEEKERRKREREKRAEKKAQEKAELEATGEDGKLDPNDTDYTDEEIDDDSDSDLSDAKGPAPKPTSYFESPLGKFFMNIGINLVQEFVQTDLLKMTKRKLNKGSANSAENQVAVQSLLKNLEQSKENNKPYKFEMKQCKFCNFKTESDVVLEHHLEIPHFKNFVYCCNFCPVTMRTNQDMLIHMQTEHKKSGRMERAPSFHQCPNCPFEDNQKSKITRHMISCQKRFRPEKNLEPPLDWEPPAKIPRVPKQRQMLPVNTMGQYANARMPTQLVQHPLLPKLSGANLVPNILANVRGKGRPAMGSRYLPDLKAMPKAITPSQLRQAGNLYNQKMMVPNPYQLSGNQMYQRWQQQQSQVLPAQLKSIMQGGTSVPLGLTSGSLTIQTTNKSPTAKLLQQPSISITPLPRQTNASSCASSSPAANQMAKPGQQGGKNSFVICEICDGYIKDLEQLRNHMQWIHKVKIHPKMIYNRPPLNCQKCQFRFFTDQGLERHLLGSHGLVTSSMQEASNKGKDGGRCPVCGRVYQWKLLNHVAKDHNMTLKPAHLSYKCTVCTATFGMYKQFENHVYSAHSVVAKRVMDKKTSGPPARPTNSDSLLKPLKINDEITIIPQPAKAPMTGRGGAQKKADDSGSENSM